MSSSHYVMKGNPGMQNQQMNNKAYGGQGPMSRQPPPDVSVKKSNTGGNGMQMGAG